MESLMPRAQGCAGAVIARLAALVPKPRGINASMHVIACVEDPLAIAKILKHLKEKAVSDNIARPPPGRAPPQIELVEYS